MKKIHVFLSIFLLILTLSACAKKQGNLTFYDTKGKVEFSIEEVEGAIVWYDAKGNEVARCEEPHRDMQGRVDDATLTVNGEELTLFWSYGVYDLGMQADAPLGAFSIRGEDDRYLRARWFDPDGKIYYEVRYEFDGMNRPISLYSTGAEPEFCYRVQWEYSERVAGIGEKALCITEHKYDANGVRIYSQETWGGNQSIDDYRDLASEANHFSYEAERFSWLDVTRKTDYSEGGIDYQIRTEDRKKDGELRYYEKIGTEDGKPYSSYIYRRDTEDEFIVKRWSAHRWDGGEGSHQIRMVYRVGEELPTTSRDEFYDEAGDLTLSLDYDARIGYTKIVEYNGEEEKIRLLREIRDSRGADGGWYWADVEQLDENGSKIEFACIHGNVPETFLPGAVRHFVRCNKSGEAERDVYFHRNNVLVGSDYMAWK
ncbi:MAG: hypothetical protein E7449_04565 [Ruminococcaceae bacterium]|nr:hypothetical protein [Oscillospiraceae bacterium]